MVSGLSYVNTEGGSTMAKKIEHRDFLPIGTWIRFDHRVVAQEKSAENGWSRDFQEIPMIKDALSTGGKHFPDKKGPVEHCGQIVGGKYLRRGVTDGGGYEDPAYFTSVGKSKFVYLVRVGFINKPLWVDPERVELVEDAELTMVMSFAYQYFPWELRKRLSEEMKAEHQETPFARDEKGRFCVIPYRG